MSNKNLKVYKIQFLTDLKTMHLAVKFPCELKVIWKRSNQSAESKQVKLIDGKVQFNQTLKLNVNMYFDTTTNKFIEKKCIYNFVIFTDKGQKSAGSISFDLADFFNKRQYQIQQSFSLQKCPVKDSKIDMKIYYQQSQQCGYDSMSQISVTSQLDVSSNNPLDLSQMNDNQDNASQKSASTVEGQKTKSPQKKVQSTKKQQNFDLLNDSDVQTIKQKNNRPIKQYQSPLKQNKIGQNIKGIEHVTTKINDFVGKFKQNLSFQLKQKERKINQLTEQLQSVQQINKKLQNQLKQEKNLKQQIQSTLTNLKAQISADGDSKNKKVEQLERKLQQQKKNVEKLQKRLTDQNQKGQEQGKYIQQLKQDFQKQQAILKKQISKLQSEVNQQKLQKSQLESKYKGVSQNYEQLNQKYDRLLNKYENLEEQIKKRQKQIQQTRIDLDKAVQNLISSLSNML